MSFSDSSSPTPSPEAQPRRRSEIDQARDDVEALTYTVSHDLRSPLGAVLNFSALLADEYGEKLGPEGRDWLERIERNANKAVQMMDSMLTYSRVGRAVLDVDTLRMAPLVQSIVDDCNRGEDTPLELELGDVPDVVADRELVRQAVRELVDNVLRFRKEGQRPRLRVTGRQVDDCVELEFRDEGSGFEAEDPTLAFRLFQRFHRTGSSGLGTGLAIVRRVLEVHNGSVAIDSTPAAGTTVCLCFPRDPKREAGPESEPNE